MRELRPYQKIAVEHVMEVPRCAIWARPGAGKTAIVLAALAGLTVADDVRRTLIIAPLRVARDVWSDEIERWPTIKSVLGPVIPIVGTAAQRKQALRIRAGVYTTNFESIQWLVDQLGGDWPFDTVVVDEASKLRGFRTKQGTKRSRALAQFAHTKIRRFVELTGTPAANSLTALWAQAWFIDGGHRLGRSFEAFRQRWFYTIGDPMHGNLEPLPFAEQQIVGALADVCLTIDPADWFDLRRPVVTRVPVKLPPRAREAYRRVQKELYADLQNGSVTAFNAAAKSAKLRQIASGSVYLDGDGREWEEVHGEKIDALDDLLEELNEPAVVAYEFVSDRVRLLARFKDAVDLATAEGLRRFKAGDARIGLAHPAALSHGVDGLQHKSRTTVFYSSGWDAELREQLLERTGPMRQLQAGFERNALVYDLVSVDTVDEVILARYETKSSIQQALLDAMKMGI